MEESNSIMIHKKEMRDFRQDVTIDPSKLEDEWVIHSSLYLHYSCEYSKAYDQKEKLKQKLDWLSAKLDLAIRQNPKEYNFNDKVTETGIKNTIILDKKYQELLSKYNKALALFTTLTGVKTAFEHRKHALGNLVALKIGGFYSEPRNIVKDVKKIQSIKGQEERKKSLQKTMKKRGIKND